MTERLPRTQVPAVASITDAMRSLEASQAQIVLVVDADRRVEGILTDGDLRRALLAGATLGAPLAPHMNTRFFSVSPAMGRAEVLELMRARQISQVPVLDGDRRAVGLHLLHEMLAVAERPNRAVIMAGGKGTRLAPLTDRMPKPMLRVAGRPILERIVLHLVGSGIRHVYLSVNHMAEMIEAHFGDGRELGCRIEYLRERAPLGTGGALALLPEPLAHPLVVMNGDLVTQADIGRMIDHHVEVGAAATMAVCKYLHRVPFGCVETRNGRVVAMEEKPMTSHLINAGIYVLDPGRLGVVVADEAVSMPEVVQRIMDGGGAVHAHELDDDWIDVGRRDELDRARSPQ